MANNGDLCKFIAVSSFDSEKRLGGFLKKLKRDVHLPAKSTQIQFFKFPRFQRDFMNLPWDKIERLILLHSINNGRFRVTDDQDAHYDQFLPNARDKLGPDNILLIVHDFPPNWKRADFEYKLKMFSMKQKTAMECTSGAVYLASDVTRIFKNDWIQILKFVRPDACKTRIKTRIPCIDSATDSDNEDMRGTRVEYKRQRDSDKIESPTKLNDNATRCEGAVEATGRAV